MSAEFRPKTKAQQRLEYLTDLKRPLTERESNELRKSMHAVYCYSRKQSILARHRHEEAELLSRVMAESRLPDVGERR